MTERTKLEKLARHPLTVAVAGTLLTLVGGYAFTKWLHDEDTSRDLLAATRSRGIDAIHELVDLINERRTRAVMLEYAILRNSPDEAIDRKAAYDEVYVRWNTKEQAIELRVKEVLDTISSPDTDGYMDAAFGSFSSVRAPKEAVLETGVTTHSGLLADMDGCVTNAFDDYRHKDFKDPTIASQGLKKCKLDHIDDNAIKCTNLVATSLYEVIANLNSPEKVSEIVRNDVNSIRGQCRD